MLLFAVWIGVEARDTIAIPELYKPDQDISPVDQADHILPWSVIQHDATKLPKLIASPKSLSPSCVKKGSRDIYAFEIKNIGKVDTVNATIKIRESKDLVIKVVQFGAYGYQKRLDILHGESVTLKIAVEIPEYISTTEVIGLITVVTSQTHVNIPFTFEVRNFLSVCNSQVLIFLLTHHLFTMFTDSLTHL